MIVIMFALCEVYQDTPKAEELPGKIITRRITAEISTFLIPIGTLLGRAERLEHQCGRLR